MADITLNVEVRDRTGTGGARATRRAGMVPGVLYGGDRDPVSIAVNENAFRKALYTGKLMGHLITLQYGKETQPVIAKAIDFHPVTDRPMHFDLYRVDEHQLIKIEVPVHFHGVDGSPFDRAGGSLEIVLHTLEIEVAADHIPEELVVDLSNAEIGDTVRISDVPLPQGAKSTARDLDAVVATVKVSSAAMSEAADERAEAEAAEGQPEAETKDEG